MEEIKTEKDNSFSTYLKKFIKTKYALYVAILLLVVILLWGVGSKFTSSPKSTQLGLYNIGELATQVAYVTEVDVIEDPRTLFGTDIEIPFTKSHRIYSYDFIIKAGFEVEHIIPEVDEQLKTITIKMPKAEILSCEENRDSLKVYLEEESIFSKITMVEENEALKKMKENAKTTAIDNGLLENAQQNAKTVITGLYANQFDPLEYKYEFLFE